MNFGLKSEREQNSIIFQFQGFLNSLHFPIEILVQSRKLDLTPYLTKLKKRASEQSEELLKNQTLDYIDFISELINMANIMKKRFYIVIGWQNLELQKLSLVDRLLNKGNSVSLLKITEKEFNTHGEELRQKAGTIAAGLGGIGLHCKQLSTADLIGLFYSFYNPGVADKERLTDLENLQANIVTGSTQEKEFSVEKPHNTTDETPIIDNSNVVKEQGRLKIEEEAAQKALQGQKPQQSVPQTEKQVNEEEPKQESPKNPLQQSTTVTQNINNSNLND